jgi:hypothetical protein
MLQKMSADVAYCYGRARDCFAKAREASNELIKADFLDLEVRWLLLAQSYQFPERTTSVIREFAVRKCRARPPAGNDPSSDPNDAGMLATAFGGAMQAAGLTLDETEFDDCDADH